MFFSEELLTRRKDGLGIVWLIGTLGARTRRVSKKEIVGCDIVKACETIAEPPEPMALRMSSCLLMGVARVYHQSCDHLHKDVITFHTALRQALVTAPISGPGGAIAGLDMPSERTKRVEQITIIAAGNPEHQVGLDWGFTRLNWDDIGAPAKRKMNDFESEDGDVSDTDDLEDDDDDGDALDPSSKPPSKKVRSAYQSSVTSNERPGNMAREEDITLPRHRRYSNSFELDDGSEDERHSRELNDQYFAGEDVAKDLGFDFGGASSSGPIGRGGFELYEPVDIDQQPDFDMGGNFDMGGDMMDFGDQMDLGDDGVRRPSQPDYNPDAADEQARKDLADGFNARDYRRLPTPALSDRQREMTAESGAGSATRADVFGDVDMDPADNPQPEARPKKRAPKPKKVKSLPEDGAIELSRDECYAFRSGYQKNMNELRVTASKKSEGKTGEAMSKKLLLGPFDWLPFSAPDMINFYIDITAPRSAPPAKRPDMVEDEVVDYDEPDSARQRLQSRDPDYGGDLGMNDMDFNMDFDNGMDNNDYREDFEDYQVPLKGGSEVPTSAHSVEVETGRRASQAFSTGEGNFPWDNKDEDSLDNFAIPTSSAGGDRFSLPPAADVNVRLSRRLSSLGGSSVRRSTSADPTGHRRRSASAVPSLMGSEVPFEEYDELELPDMTPKSRRQSSVVDEGLSQEILVSLDPSCRNFLTFVNKKQYRASGEPVLLNEIFPSKGAKAVTRKVACQAFYNCLSLATKNLLNVEQPEPWGEISITIAPTV